MTYRIVARNSDARTGVAKLTAAEALQAVHQLSGDGFHLTAIIDDDGDAVQIEKLEELARVESGISH